MNAAFESFDLGRLRPRGVLAATRARRTCSPAPGTLHVCYCHTPMRHAWEPRLPGRRAARAGRRRWPPAAAAAACAASDLAGASRPDVFVANSRHVAGADRASTTGATRASSHPPVDVDAPPGAAARPRGLLPRARAASCRTSASTSRVAACADARPPGQGRRRPAARSRPPAPPPGPDAEFLGYVADDELGDAAGGRPRAALPGRGGLRDRARRGAGRGRAGDRLRRRRRPRLGDRRRDRRLLRRADRRVAAPPRSCASRTRTLDEAAMRDNARRFGPERFRSEIAELLRRAARLRAEA